MEKPRLSFWQISNMSFGFLGIQFGWGLQLANMSAIYSYLGAKESDIPLLWLAGPMTGLIVQPIIGAMSDRTWTCSSCQTQPGCEWRPACYGSSMPASMSAWSLSARSSQTN